MLYVVNNLQCHKLEFLEFCIFFEKLLKVKPETFAEKQINIYLSSKGGYFKMICDII